MRRMNDSSTEQRLRTIRLLGTLVLLVANRMEAQTETRRQIIVSVPDCRLAFLENGSVKKVYRVAVGKQNTPSPTGKFKVVNRLENPTYYHQGKVVGRGRQIRWAIAGSVWIRRAMGSMEPTLRSRLARRPRTDASGWRERTWKSCSRRFGREMKSRFTRSATRRWWQSSAPPSR